MNAPPFLGEFVVLVIASAAIAYLCQRLRIQPIVGFLIAGVVIGPHALGLVRNARLIDSMAEIGVVLLLFTLGIEFSLKRLARIQKIILVGGSAQMGLTIALVALAVALAGWDWRTGIYAGCLVALSSTAVVLKLLEARQETTTRKGQVALGILIFQDLSLVALLLLMPILASGDGSLSAPIASIARSAAIVVLILLLARRLMPWILEKVAAACAPEIFLLSVIAMCVGTAWLTSLAGVSLSLGAFLAGLVVSESRFSHHAFGEILPLQLLFSAMFFVSVGLLLDLRFVWGNVTILLAVLAAIVVVKTLATGATTMLLGYPFALAASTGLLLAQIGEFSFVLERVGRVHGLEPPGLAGMGTQTFLAAAVILMICTPLLERLGILIEERLAERGTRRIAEDADRAPETSLLLENHVLIGGYGAVARYLARVLRDSGIPTAVLTLSPPGASEVERERLPVIIGDYSRIGILNRAAIDHAKMLVIPDDLPDMARRVSAVARSLNPTLNIVARTRSPHDVEEILAAGADEVLVDEVEVSIQLFSRVLFEYRVSLEEIDDHVRTVRAGGYAALRMAIEDVPLVVCDDLNEECFDTRTFAIREGAQVAGRTVGELSAQTGIRIVSVERGGQRLEATEELPLAAGDRISARASAAAFASGASLFRTSAPAVSSVPTRVIRLTPEQIAAAPCEHVQSVLREIASSATGCEDCLRIGDRWVQLRICMSCGGVRCCDSSKNRHATQHYQASTHPIIKSYLPDEGWAWCYPDQLSF
jgi:CPA2 family monovalent cation:H+ antiporter-2